MKRLVPYIQQHLSLRLGLLIVFIVTVVFSLLFNYLLYRCKHFIQNAAIERASQLLDNTAERINGIMEETELVTNFLATTTPHHLHPDSLLVFTRRAVIENPFLTGMAISMEPNFFPEMGRYYSAYSLRDMTPGSDSITTVREGPFEYFDAIWYKGNYLGSITASLTLKWLSEAVSQLKPYANSSAIMIGRNGTYLVHPDTAKLLHETIFSDPDPKAVNDIKVLGRRMLTGHSGMMQTIVDGRPAFIFYRPVPHTQWSIAIVCPQSDVYARYNKLIIGIWVVLGLGILLLMLFCYQTVRHAILPLQELDEQAHRIAEGHFDEPLPESTRHDSVGRLTNSFILMQQSLARTVNDIRNTNMELSTLNSQLTEAYKLKLDTNRRKTELIHFMYHEIRTPLNIISGFAQVLAVSLHSLETDEVEDITTRMQESAKDISRLTHELGEAANNHQVEQ